MSDIRKCEMCEATAKEDLIFGDVPANWGITYDRENHRFNYYCNLHWDRLQKKGKTLNGLTSVTQESVNASIHSSP